MTGTATVPGSRSRAELRPTGTRFPALVAVELRRLWWRRLTKAVIIGVLAFVGVSTYSAYVASTPEALAQRLEQYATIQADMERQKQEMAGQLPQLVERCREDQTAERARSGDATVDFGCDRISDQFQPPTLEQMGILPPVADTITATTLTTGVFVFAFLALLLMGSYVGAEFSTGAMGNWLTFQPRRVRVALSKLVAAVLGSAVVAALGIALTNLGARAIATVNRTGSDLALPDPPALASSVPELMLRCIGLAVFAGVLGAALGLVLRHTAAIIGGVLGWLVVVEGIAVNNFLQGRLHPWAVLPNANAFINKGATYVAESCSAASCQYSERTLTYTHGWVYLLVVGVSAAVVAVLVFRRRDVT